MANEPSKTPLPQPQVVPLSKIHDLPGAVISKQPDKSYGGLVTSIQAGGVKEPVVLRLREDGEYQLVTGYRRRRACELAKLKDIPALIYEMSMPAALNFHRQVKNQPDIPIPGKPVLPAAPDKKGPTADVKGPEKPTAPTPAQGQQKPNQGKEPAQTAAPAADKAKDGDKPAQEPKPAAAQGQEKPTKGKDPAQAPAPAPDKAKDGGKPIQEPKPATAQGQQKPNQGKDPAQAPDKAKDRGKPTQEPKPAAAQGQEEPTERKDPAQTAAPAATDKAKEGNKPTQEPKPAAAQGQEKPIEGKDPAQAPAPAAADKAKEGDKPTQEPKPTAAQGQQKPTEGKGPAQAPAPAVTGTVAKGPIGTAISQVLPDRLSPPDEAARKDFPAPKEGESFSVVLHPAYLEKSEYNTVSVDTKSEDYAELKKSIELAYNLTSDGWEVTPALNAKTAAALLAGTEYDLVLMDINLPDGNGYDLCRLIKPGHPDTVVIFLTANDQEADQLRGYEVGAVDYITKPFSIEALQRKIHAMFAMLEHHRPARDIYDDGRLFLDFSEQAASLNGNPLSLSPMEYKMLFLFCKNPRQVLTRQRLLERLWDVDEKFVDEHTLTTSISRVRGKIEAEGDTYIKTIYGIGYQWTGGERK